MARRITYICGGARSGKSRYALEQVNARDGRKVFVATAEAIDPEMSARIERHRAERDDEWLTIEAPLDLVTAITDHGADDAVLLIDCLTLWVGNLMHHKQSVRVHGDELLDALRACRSDVLLVANEVGLGIVPATAMARDFRDEAGWLNQAVAALADEAVMMLSGLPLRLK